VTASMDTKVKVLSASDGKIVKELIDHSDNVTSAWYTNDGIKIISSSFDYTVIVWNAED